MNKKAFTLIEIIVAITITSMVLVSIVEIFLFSGMFSKKIDSSRVMQENIKNFTEIIAEDVRTN
jgi:prepilin-type N-terminal cleavage/methylation domain-containing protein